LKNAKNRDISATVPPIHEAWHDDAERVSQEHRPLKKFTLKIQDGGRPICLRDPFCIIMSIAIFKMAAVRHLGILKLKVLTAGYFRDTF